MAKREYVIYSIFIIILTSMQLLSAIDFNITTPKDGELYNNSFVNFRIDSDSKLNYFYSSNSNDFSRWKKLCQNVNYSCIAKIRGVYGDNTLYIKATDNYMNSTIKSVNIKIDNKKPVVSKTYPLPNKVVNGSLFYIIYTEENPVNVTLVYGKDYDLRKVISNCSSGIKQRCDFSLTENNISDFNNQEINYWFEVFDGANNVITKKTKLYIDTQNPNLINFQKNINKGKVEFLFEVDERNLEKIRYTSMSDCGPSLTPSGTLCSRLNDGRCIVSKSFCIGSHNLTIILEDKAGNSVTIPSNFIINY